MVRLHNQSHGTGPLNLSGGSSTREVPSANHASNLYLLPHMPNAGALSHTKPGTNVSHLTINTHKCRVSVDGILRRVVNNRPLRESRETCSSIFIVPSLNTWEVYSSQLYPHCLVLFLFFFFQRDLLERHRPNSWCWQSTNPNRGEKKDKFANTVNNCNQTCGSSPPGCQYITPNHRCFLPPPQWFFSFFLLFFSLT